VWFGCRTIQVDWKTEKPCFRGVCEELASFYSVQPGLHLHARRPLPPAVEDALAAIPSDSAAVAGSELSSAEPSNISAQQSQPASGDLKWQIQHVLYPALRTSFTPPKHHASDGSIVEIASLDNLYKIFERC